MQVAILGATGCVGRNLIKKLITSNEHDIIASCRYENKIDKSLISQRLEWRTVNLEYSESIKEFLQGAEVLVYLVHSLQSSGFESLDKMYAHKVGEVVCKADIKKIIYMSGIIPRHEKLSHHLKSRMETGEALASHGISVGEVRASILLGTCSASYRMIYYLAKRLPLMITPKWLNSLCAPIALDDAVEALEALINREIEGHEIFEIGSDIMRYCDLLSLCGKSTHGYENAIFTVPFFAISLSSLWIEFITGVPNSIARTLAESLVNDSVYSNNRFKEITGHDPKPVKDVLKECAEQMKKEREERIKSFGKKKGS
ncbi:MAG: NAD(P)H-binding protein [Candidatus Kuenenia sp.]|nr:NAD(P)H-binding protein [Candidatus Kuenenia hertensis]